MTRLINPDEQFFDNTTGAPLALGTAYFGEPNQDPETNPKTVYADSSLEVGLGASQSLTAAGKVQQPIYLNGTYSLTVRDRSGSLIFNEDYVEGRDSSADVQAKLDRRLLYVDSIADLLALNTAALKDGQQIGVAGFYPGAFALANPASGGCGVFAWSENAAKSAHTVGTVISPTVPWNGTVATLGDFLAGTGETDPAGAGCWMRLGIEDGVNLSAFGAKRGEDIAPVLQAAVDASPGTHDITTAYIYEPAWQIDIPYGDYLMRQRVVITKNNINIRGAGMFATTLKCPNDTALFEMIRFKGAYACSLKQVTVDGGLPFNPAGSETYGADTPVVLDQVAHFEGEINISNYRIRGLQCIHVWESIFYDLRVHSGGYFGTVSGVQPACIAFDDYRKEENFFSGSESNQITFVKFAAGGVGNIIRMEAPCFNIHFGQIVAEGRTFSGFQPGGMDSPKFYVSGVSSLITAGQIWCYFHDQPFECNATLFDFANVGPGCQFDNVFVYQEMPEGAVGQHMEVTNLIANSSASPVDIKLSVEDRNNNTALWNSSAPGALIKGSIEYRNDTARAFEEFEGLYTAPNFVGDISYSTGDFTTTPPTVYRYDGRAQRKSSAVAGGDVYDEFAVRAIANISGAGTVNMAKGFATIQRTGAGSYQFDFAKPMPDANYSVSAAISKANLGDDWELGSLSAESFSIVVRDGAGVQHDAPTLTVSVFR